jgi:myosin heavy subunit
MNKRELKRNVKVVYSSKEKRKRVEEIRSGLLSLRQSIQEHQVSGSVLQRWNRWYFKTRLLRYYRPKPSFLMAPSQTTIEQLKQELAEAQAQLAQVKLQNTALQTMISVAEKQLNIEIRKKYGSKRFRS